MTIAKLLKLALSCGIYPKVLGVPTTNRSYFFFDGAFGWGYI